MRICLSTAVILILLSSCDGNRVFEKNHDFEASGWRLNDSVIFDFEIKDTLSSYNIYCNIRNSLNYPYARFFVRYELQDSSGKNLNNKLAEAFLFDRKTGKPFGTSGLGDIYDQRVPIISEYHFPYNGKYKLTFTQEMRKDTIDGILAVGLRIEKESQPIQK
jgi:gliding motility-associated lipoprotein GldH